MADTVHEDSTTDVVRRVAYIFNPSDDQDDEALLQSSATPSRRRAAKKHRSSHEESSRPAKKRRTAAAASSSPAAVEESSLAAFPTLLKGRENPASVARRGSLFRATWDRLDTRIQKVLHRANQATLDAVLAFVRQDRSPAATAPVFTTRKIPAAFVILGPAATTDMLLFQQLSTALADEEQEANSRGSSKTCLRRMVRLRAAEAPNLRAALKAIVQGATAGGKRGEADDEEVAHDGRKYLAYDLEAVYAAVRGRADARIVIAFEDSEAFDSGLLADLLAFLHSWIDRIPFVLLFGVATSVDLFQARLPKAAGHRLAVAQFDVAPSSAVLDRLVRQAVAAADVPLQIGPTLLRSLAERQDEQVAGVSVFVGSLKYAYMCYFYANPLSVMLPTSENGDDDDKETTRLLQDKDYVACIRQLPSFRRYVESLVANGRTDSRQLAARLLEDDTALRQAVQDQTRRIRQWKIRLLRGLLLATASGVFADQSFTELYITALEGSRSGAEDEAADDQSLSSTLTRAIHRMSASDLADTTRRLAAAVQAGDPDLGINPVNAGHGEEGDDDDERSWRALVPQLGEIADKVDVLQKQIEDDYWAANARHRQHRAAGGGVPSGMPQLRSKYTAQSKVLRTTVVAQKVQLSRDSAALTPEDQAFTDLVDAVVDLVVGQVSVEDATGLFSGLSGPDGDPNTTTSPLWLQEVWLYDSRTPYRDVFVPRPGLVLERALARPHDYLACECCSSNGRNNQKGDSGSIVPSLPATAILYQLYQEAGTLLNVADLWTAFLAIVGDGQDLQEAEKEADEDDEEDDTAERRRLVQFYQGLAELKALGFVKATRKKADHVAKVKWL